MALVEVVTVLALVQFIAFGWLVGRARVRFGIAAPATTGHEHFERYMRVHLNTVEVLVVFLPALWLFALRVDPYWAAGFGAVYLVGRLIYFRSYTRDPKSRSLGFALSMLPAMLMLLGVLYVAVRSLLV
jgi:uncharacterized membrane protein YecN with MAPEG domain